MIRKTLIWLKALLLLILLSVVVKMFIIDTFHIQTGSMKPLLLSGDYIMVSKVHYGPRFTYDIPWTNALVWSIPRNKNLNKLYSGFYDRLSGIDMVRRRDIIVFIHPQNKGKFLIKRCVAVSGDTILIRNNQLFVNSIPQDSCWQVQFQYRVFTDYRVFNIRLLHNQDNSGISNYYKLNGEIRLFLTPYDVRNIAHLPGVDSVQLVNSTDFSALYNCFPHSMNLKNYNWTFDNFGPLVVPSKGTKVILIPEILPIYNSIIKEYEGHSVEVNNGMVKVDGEPVSSYTFEMDYYFMLGDNRHSSIDSRFWGFVPEDHIIGKTWFILLSLNQNEKGWKKIRWERMFRKVE